VNLRYIVLMLRRWIIRGLALTLLTPLFGYTLQARAPGPLLLLAVLPLCALQFAMLLAIEFPDRAGDALTDKRTLIVRLGAWRGARLYAAVTGLAFAVLPLLALLGLPWRAAAAAALPAPIALWRIRRTLHGDWRRPRRWETLTFWAVALLVLTTVAELAGIVF